MIILDTNAVSETLKPTPSESMLRWLGSQEQSAREYARILVSRKASGRPMSQFDAMIAAIVRVHRATLATRNVRDFEHCGIRLINPWTAPEVHYQLQIAGSQKEPK